MVRLRSWFEETSPLVADASVWINLEATKRIEQIIQSLSRRLIITESALGELERGRKKGRPAADAVMSLVSIGLVDIVALKPEHEKVFLDLVSGTTSQSLDDGEAATLAYSLGIGGVAIIDERKATSIARIRFPELLIASTSAVLFAPAVCETLAGDNLADAFFYALTLARMRVPDFWLEKVSNLLGHERIQLCPSMPTRYRNDTVRVLITPEEI